MVWVVNALNGKSDKMNGTTILSNLPNLLSRYGYYRQPIPYLHVSNLMYYFYLIFLLV